MARLKKEIREALKKVVGLPKREFSLGSASMEIELDGRIYINSGYLTPNEALKLRDFINEILE